MVLLALLLHIANATADDACALRARLTEPAAELVAAADTAPDARTRACLQVVAALAFERAHDVPTATTLLNSAALTLQDIAAEIAAHVAARTVPPTPALTADNTLSPDEAAARILAMVAAADAQAAAAYAIGYPRGAIQHDALEVATVTALVRAQRYSEAHARAETLARTDATRYIRAWAFSKAQRFADAKDAFDDLAATTQDAARRVEAQFYAAFAAYEADAFDDATKRFVALTELAVDTPFAANAWWYLALCHVLKSDHAKAVDALRTLVTTLPGDKEARKHRYWLASELHATQQGQGARRLWLELMNEDATDWYGLLARRRLHKPDVRGVRVAADAVLRATDTQSRSSKARLLWGLGLDAQARVAGRQLLDGPNDIATVALLQSFDDYFFGYRRGPPFLPSPRVVNGALVAAAGWRVSYATPWPSAVAAATSHGDIHADFLYAIMRTESGFDPRAVSVAGAQGATQLLPSVARQACVLRARPLADAQRIFEPEVAADLAVAILQLHRTQFGSALLAAAAYNGAPENVATWVARHGTLRSDLFVERMPFKETRDYVKKVLATAAIYRALDGAPLHLEVPD